MWQRSAGQRQRAYNRLRHRKRMQLLFYICIFLVVVVTAVILCVTVLFRIQSIAVVGKSRYAASQITQACGISPGQNLFTAKVDGAAEQVKRACPYLGEVTVSRSLPAKIVISVKEATVSGAVAWNGKFVLLDSSGKVLELSTAAPSAVPAVKGLGVISAKAGEQVQYKDAKHSKLFQEIAGAAKTAGLTGLTVIDVTDEYNLCITCKGKAGSKLTVKLGNAAYLEKKFRFAKATIDQHLSGENGTFDVSSVGREKSITWFTPASSAPAVSSKPAASSSAAPQQSSQTVESQQTEDDNSGGTDDGGGDADQNQDDGNGTDNGGQDGGE